MENSILPETTASITNTLIISSTVRPFDPLAVHVYSPVSSTVTTPRLNMFPSPLLPQEMLHDGLHSVVHVISGKIFPLTKL